MYMKYLINRNSFYEAYLESKSLREFEDNEADGTVDKNNQIYTKLYNYHMSLDNQRSRENAVGWLMAGSQERNFTNVIGYLEEGDKILDFGCGLGDFSSFIGKHLNNFEYVGVDINPKFIKNAQKTHSQFDFFHIKSPQDVTQRFDKIVAIGVFTWFITKEDFVSTINHLYSKCTEKLIITCIHSDTASHSWDNTYRGYSEDLFQRLFPKMDLEFKRDYSTLVVVFNK